MKVYKSMLKRSAIDYRNGLLMLLEHAEWLTSDAGIETWKEAVKLHIEAAEDMYDVKNVSMVMSGDPETGSPIAEINIKTRWTGRHLSFEERRKQRKRFYRYIRERETKEIARLCCNIYVDVCCFNK